MGALEIINAIEAATKLGMELYNDYQQGRVVLSETDAAAVHAALLKAQEATAALRPLVDKALQDAAARG